MEREREREQRISPSMTSSMIVLLPNIHHWRKVTHHQRPNTSIQRMNCLWMTKTLIFCLWIDQIHLAIFVVISNHQQTQAASKQWMNHVQSQEADWLTLHQVLVSNCIFLYCTGNKKHLLLIKMPVNRKKWPIWVKFHIKYNSSVLLMLRWDIICPPLRIILCILSHTTTACAAHDMFKRICSKRELNRFKTSFLKEDIWIIFVYWTKRRWIMKN